MAIKIVRGVLHFTWGIIQSLVGLFVYIYFLAFSKNDVKRFMYKGQPVTYVKGSWGGITLGFFTFVDDSCTYSDKIVAHEYGHTIQSIIFGPLWIIFFGIPSLIWAGFFDKWRVKHNKSYYWFYTESLADRLGGVER